MCNYERDPDAYTYALGAFFIANNNCFLMCYTLLMSLVAKIKADPLLRHNTIFFVGSFLVAILNYLYNPIIGRMLSVSEFGEVSVYFSLTTQIGTLLGIFNLVAIHLASNKKAESERNVLADVYAVVFLLQIIAILFIVVASPFLSGIFQFTSVAPFFLLALATYLSLPSALLTSVLQGQKQFARLSLGAFIQAGVKLVSAVLLVFLGGSVLGALAGLLIAQLVALHYYAGGKWQDIKFLPSMKPTFDSALWSELRYAVLVFLATGTVALLYTSDTVVVKYFFSPFVAGEYAGISVIAKILFFATASISAVLLPSVTLAQSKRENLRILKNSAFLTLLIGGSGLIIMSLFPALVVRLLLGAKYLPFATMLPYVALLMLATSLINLCFMYLIALRKYVLVPIAVLGILMVIVPLSVVHSSVPSVVAIFGIADGVILALLVGYLLYDNFRGQTTSLNHHSAS